MHQVTTEEEMKRVANDLLNYVAWHMAHRAAQDVFGPNVAKMRLYTEADEEAGYIIVYSFNGYPAHIRESFLEQQARKHELRFDFTTAWWQKVLAKADPDWDDEDLWQEALDHINGETDHDVTWYDFTQPPALPVVYVEDIEPRDFTELRVVSKEA